MSIPDVWICYSGVQVSFVPDFRHRFRGVECMAAVVNCPVRTNHKVQAVPCEPQQVIGCLVGFYESRLGTLSDAVTLRRNVSGTVSRLFPPPTLNVV
jgi:hypothetical protein